MRKAALLAIFMMATYFGLLGQNVNDLFKKENSLSADFRQIAKKYESLSLNATRLADISASKPSDINIELPFEGGQLKLQLEKKNFIADNFSVIEVLPGGERRTVNYNGGGFYQGKIKNVPNSFATISIFNDQVIGIVSDGQSNIVLGTIEKNGRPTNEYVLYREHDLEVENPFTCFTDDVTIEGGNSVDGINTQQSPNAVGEPVDVYFECDFKFYQDKGNNTTNLINYVLGFFNNTALIYENENVKIQVSQILVWTTQDPEAAAGLGTAGNVLSAFSSRMASTSYIGDYAHFLSTRSLGGGVAWLLNNPCSASRFNRTAVSGIHNSYSNFPTYSWTVQVVTHELGHNLGSNHTQWCGWPGGPLDNCYTPEGGCSNGPSPTNGGTIMSYCHLTGNGINFNNGFGLLPGNKIRSVVTNATCFSQCRMTIDIAKQDASCGQNNGSATVSAINGTGNISYTWSNGQTGATLSGVAPGTYHVRVSDEANCQVMQVVTIGNSGTGLAFSLSPSGAAGYCPGGSVTLSATSNPSYTYVWRKDGNIIVGASSFTYSASSPGTYSVTVTSGACNGTLAVVVSEVSSPAANITASGATTICDGNNVLLNANAGASYAYQWYNQGNSIAGATNPTYSATANGTYTVKVSAGTNCEATSTPVIVTVNPSPNSSLSAGSSTSFCAGNSVTLNASTGAGYTYKWYRNNSLIAGENNPTFIANTGGNYTVSTTIGACSRTSQGLGVIVWSNPVINVTPAVSTIEKFQTQTLSATGAINYNWNAHPSLVSGSNASAVYRPLTTTDYLIVGTDNNGCIGTMNARINVIGCGDVTDITDTTYSPSRVIVRWKNPTGVTTDTLQYRIAGTQTWTRVFVIGEEYEINGLQPGTTYEYNIIPLCNTTTVYLPSATSNFTTNELEDGLYIRLYPNPVSSTSKLEIISSVGFTFSMAAFDNTGRMVMASQGVEQHMAGQVMKTFNAGTLANGSYYLQVNINGKNHTVKMIVIR